MAEQGSRDEHWADVVSQWRASGLSRKEFCWRRDISDRFIPEPHSRCLTITLHAASVTPLPIGSFAVTWAA